MAHPTKYKKSDFKRMSWEEYGKLLDDLYGRLHAYITKKKIRIDAVVPILRGGAFPGTFLTYKLHLLRILPVQYKYFFVGKNIELRKILGVPTVKLSKRPTFLLVENNHCFGLTAATAAKDLRKQFPGCKVICAADTMDYAYRGAVKAEAVFYGAYTNETRALTPLQCKKMKIFGGSNLFPWESIAEEWTTLQGKEFKYGDASETLSNSKKKKVIKAALILNNVNKG